MRASKLALKPGVLTTASAALIAAGLKPIAVRAAFLVAAVEVDESKSLAKFLSVISFKTNSSKVAMFDLLPAGEAKQKQEHLRKYSCANPLKISYGENSIKANAILSPEIVGSLGLLWSPDDI